MRYTFPNKDTTEELKKFPLGEQIIYDHKNK